MSLGEKARRGIGLVAIVLTSTLIATNIVAGGLAYQVKIQTPHAKTNEVLVGMEVSYPSYIPKAAYSVMYEAGARTTLELVK